MPRGQHPAASHEEELEELARSEYLRVLGDYDELVKAAGGQNWQTILIQLMQKVRNRVRGETLLERACDQWATAVRQKLRLANFGERDTRAIALLQFLTEAFLEEDHGTGE